MSNHAVWRVERAPALAAAAGPPGYEVLQYRHSHLRPRSGMPSALFPDGSLGEAGAELLSCLRAEPALTLVASAPPLNGAYGRPDKPLPLDYGRPGTPARLAVLRDMARETGATVNKVVDLQLTAEQRARLDAAH